MIKHAGNNAVHGVKKAVEQRAVFDKKCPEIFIYSKNTMTMLSMNQFKGHTGSALHGIFVSTGRTEPAVTTERNKFKFATVWTGIHGAAEGRVTAVDHFINIFHLRISGMESIFDFFIMICKDLL